MQSATEILIAARELIADPAHWTQTFYARDADGIFTDVLDEAACKFCGYGAVLRATNSHDWTDASVRAAFLLERVVGPSFASWQDARKRTHSEVLAAFDRAIELARAGL